MDVDDYEGVKTKQLFTDSMKQNVDGDQMMDEDDQDLDDSQLDSRQLPIPAPGLLIYQLIQFSFGHLFFFLNHPRFKISFLFLKKS